MNLWTEAYKCLREKAALHLQPVSLTEIDICQSTVVAVKKKNTYGLNPIVVAKGIRVKRHPWTDMDQLKPTLF